MKTIQVQGVHHITLVGSTKQSAVDFWQGLLGMPFIFEQPNLGKPDENHLYFDPGDGRLLTVFTNESRADAAPPARTRHRLHSARSRVHGLDLSAGSERAEGRTGVLQVRGTRRRARRR